MNDSKNIDLGYEPLGCVCYSKGMSIALYIFAAVLVIAGIIVYFAVMPSAAVLAVFVFFAARAVLCGVSFKKSIWYYGEEKFTVTLFLSKSVTYSYDEIERVNIVSEPPAVTIVLCMQNGKEHGFTPNQVGAKEFIALLDAKQKQKQESINKV